MTRSDAQAPALPPPAPSAPAAPASPAAPAAPASPASLTSPASPASPPAGYLVLRRAGGLWGVAYGAVAGVSRASSGYRVALAHGALAADEVLGVVPGLAVRPAPRALRLFWPEALSGLGMHRDLPLVLVDPAAPPRALAEPPGEPPPALAPPEAEPCTQTQREPTPKPRGELDHAAKPAG